MTDLTARVLGPVVGPLQPTLETISIYTRSRIKWDFAINGVPFLIAPGDEHPYVRQTAPIRKEQVDTSPDVGDQSLTGMWLRGQQSFHRGQGVRYYEVAQGEEVFNRYQSSLALDPWTPGRLTLARKWTSLTTTSVKYVTGNSDKLAGVTLADQIIVIKSNDVVSSSAFAEPCKGAAVDDDGTVYAVMGNIIYTIGANNDGTCTRTALWTHSTGTRVFQGVWWGKNRLWTVDETGRWYAVSRAGGTVADTDTFWLSGATTGLWNVSESPGAMYVSRKHRVYAVKVEEASGDVAVLAAPAVAGQLPRGENIFGMTFHLGYLVLATTSGVRVMTADSGNETVGPLFIRDTATSRAATNLAPSGDFVFVPSAGDDDDDDYHLYQINLADFVSDLTPAYARRLSPWVTGESYPGACESTGRLDDRVKTVCYGAFGIKRETATFEDTGEVYTGFHRFGTLEPKVFHSVAFKVEGTEGTIGVTLVRKGGVEQPLISLPPDGSVSEEVALGIPEGEEFIGLKFVLTKGTTEGPTLLGYQLKALPAPIRQRLIQVPLMCFDHEKRAGVQVGRRGGAWGRYMALEGIEDSGSTVTYQDFRTGEQGVAYIEGLEWQHKTPPSDQSSGVGGLILLTLRKVG